MADHELGPAFYALQAVEKSTHNDQDAIGAERRWQVERLCPLIKEFVLDDMRLRTAKFRGVFDQHG